MRLCACVSVRGGSVKLCQCEGVTAVPVCVSYAR